MHIMKLIGCSIVKLIINKKEKKTQVEEIRKIIKDGRHQNRNN